MEAQQLKEIVARCPEFDRAALHVRAFAELMDNRQGSRLSQWIEGVRSNDLPALHAFVNGLGRDRDAVVAGLSLPLQLRRGRGTQHQDQGVQTPDARARQLRPPARVGPTRSLSPFMIALPVTLRGPSTESDPEPEKWTGIDA